MTTEEYLKMLRRKVADVDVSAKRRSDTELLETTSDIRLELAMRQLDGFDGITVGTIKANTATYGIKNATDEQMLLLIYGTAHAVLAATYRERVDRGELGISWQSGLESESSISAEKAYKQMLDELKRTCEELTITYQRKLANGRIH